MFHRSRSSELGIDEFSLIGIRVVFYVIVGYRDLHGMDGNVQTVDNDVDVLGCGLDQLVVYVLELLC